MLGRLNGSGSASDERDDFHCPFDPRHTHLASAIQVRAYFASLRFFGHTDSKQLVMFLEFFAVHGATAIPSSARRLFNAVRTHVFTVPNGCPIFSAISVCESPSK